MRRFVVSALSIGAVLLAGCPMTTPPPPKPTPSTAVAGVSSSQGGASVASGAWVGGMPPEVTLPPDSPYCDLKKGQIWTIKKGSHVVAGGEVIDRFEIRHVTEKYVDTIYSTVVPKMPRYQDAQTFQKVFFLNKKPEQIFGPAVIPQAGQKPIDTETLEYSGFKFPCEVYEEVGRDGNVRRVWFSKKFPMRIKVFDPKDGFVEEVLSIEQH